MKSIQEFKKKVLAQLDSCIFFVLLKLCIENMVVERNVTCQSQQKHSRAHNLGTDDKQKWQIVARTSLQNI